MIRVNGDRSANTASNESGGQPMEGEETKDMPRWPHRTAMVHLHSHMRRRGKRMHWSTN